MRYRHFSLRSAYQMYRGERSQTVMWQICITPFALSIGPFLLVAWAMAIAQERDNLPAMRTINAIAIPVILIEIPFAIAGMATTCILIGLVGLMDWFINYVAAEIIWR